MFILSSKAIEDRFDVSLKKSYPLYPLTQNKQGRCED